MLINCRHTSGSPNIQCGNPVCIQHMEYKVAADKSCSTCHNNCLTHNIFPQYIHQIFTILVFLNFFIYFQYIFFGDPTIAVCDFFQAGNLAVLMHFNRLDKVRCIYQALMSTVSSQVKPCPKSSTFSLPCSRYILFRSVISSSFLADGFKPLASFTTSLS